MVCLLAALAAVACGEAEAACFRVQLRTAPCLERQGTFVLTIQPNSV